MVLELSKSFVHNNNGQGQRQYSDEEIKALMLDLLQKCGVNTNTACLTEDDRIELNCLHDLRLHTVMLEAEKMGLTLKFTKKTFIEVCCEDKERLVNADAMESAA